MSPAYFRVDRRHKGRLRFGALSCIVNTPRRILSALHAFHLRSVSSFFHRSSGKFELTLRGHHCSIPRIANAPCSDNSASRKQTVVAPKYYLPDSEVMKYFPLCSPPVLIRPSLKDQPSQLNQRISDHRKDVESRQTRQTLDEFRIPGGEAKAVRIKQR